LALIAGGVVSLVEAWTPHGLDNLTIPLSAAVLMQGFLILQ
jgi:dolichol kinase